MNKEAVKYLKLNAEFKKGTGFDRKSLSLYIQETNSYVDVNLRDVTSEMIESYMAFYKNTFIEAVNLAKKVTTPRGGSSLKPKSDSTPRINNRPHQ